jgi:hypothetical protein
MAIIIVVEDMTIIPLPWSRFLVVEFRRLVLGL